MLQCIISRPWCFDIPTYRISRLLIVLCACLGGALTPAPSWAQAADADAASVITPNALFTQVIAEAKELAATPYEAPKTLSDDEMSGLNYSDFQKIRFRPEKALWRGQSLFEVQFFHPGFLYKQPVSINVLEDGKVREVPFDKSKFRYDIPGLEAKVPDNLGYAGFRIHYPLNKADYKDELAVFLGASYFRLLASGQVYGLSARGLAVDTALSAGEEFPVFRKFWLVKPSPTATSMTVLALLDSHSVTGAYRFVIHPGVRTVVDVDCTLYVRQSGHKFGIAPLTSMFLYGENSRRHFDDFRPEVHDSDGLLMHTGRDEWIWRPLTNPKKLHVSDFMDNNPKGFGLMQRDRDFGDYMDMETNYQRRPSLWVEPRDVGWGKGTVRLVEIPSDEEIHDNIVAFWVFDRPMVADSALRLSYRLTSLSDMPAEEHLARVLRSRSGWAGIPGAQPPLPKTVRRFVVDFSGGDLSSLAGDQPVDADIESSAGAIDDVAVRKLPGDSGLWRLSFRLKPVEGRDADMRAILKLRGRTMSETWSYLYASAANK